LNQNKPTTVVAPPQINTIVAAAPSAQSALPKISDPVDMFKAAVSKENKEVLR
jgi:hypothetical protein